MLLAGLVGFGLLYVAQPVLPDIALTFGRTPSLASLAVSAATAALAVAVLPVAALARRWGRVRTMEIGMTGAVLLTGVMAVAPTFSVLVAGRFAAGLALAAVVAVAMGHVGVEMHPSGLAAAMGLYVAGNTLGGVGGRLVTALVSGLAGWRWGVGAVAVLAALLTVAFVRLVPDSVSPPSAAARTHRRRLRPAALVLALVPFTLMGGFVAVYNYLGFRLTAPPFSLSVATAGLAFLAYLAGTATSAIAGRSGARFGPLPVIVVSVLVLLTGLALTSAGSLAVVVVGLVVFTGGFFGAHATASGWMPMVARPAGPRGSALYVGAYYAGSSVFGLLVGQAWSTWGWPGVTASVAALALAGLLAAIVTGRLSRRRVGSPGSPTPADRS